MARTLLLWLQENLLSSQKVWDFLLTKPYDKIVEWDKIGIWEGWFAPLESFSWLSLIGLSGLIVFVVVAFIKWVIN